MTDIADASREPLGEPLDASSRIAIIDILRGFALGGVLFSNVHVWFSGRIYLSSTRLHEVMSHPANVAIDAIERFLTGGKFITIFSFLFGMGLCMQFDRAEKRGQTHTGFYARRGAALLVLAAIHLFLLWFGDILHVYALLGFAVLFFSRRSPKTILVSGILFSIFGAAVAKWFTTFAQLASSEFAASVSTRAALIPRTNEWMLSIFAGGSFRQIVEANAVGYWVRFVDPSAIGFFLEVFGRILLGFYAGKAGFFRDVSAHRRMFHRLLVGGLIVGASGELIRYGLEQVRLDQAPTAVQLFLPGFMRIFGDLHTAGTAAFYVAALTLLAERPWWRDKFAIFAPVGQMAVTNYLSQSVLAIIIYYGVGFGVIGDIGLRTTLYLPLSVFALQIAWSHAWLRYFRFGPVEWVWRSVTYGSMQPIRR